MSTVSQTRTISRVTPDLSNPVGPEMRALLTTRRFLLVLLPGLLVVVSSIQGARVWASLNPVEHAGLLTALTFALVGALLSRDAIGLWLCDAGVLVLALTALVGPAGSPAWIPMPNVASYSAFMAIVLTGRRAGLVIALAGAALVGMIWLRQPTNIVAGGLELWGGWIVVIQVLVTGLAAWWAWNTLVAEVSSNDLAHEVQAESVDRALADQARAQQWRATAARLHETLLNSIRYTITTAEPDRQTLRAQLDATAIAPSPPLPGPTSLERLLASALADPVASKVAQLPRVVPPETVAPPVFEATRAALVEVVHNAVSHGGATTVSVEVEVTPEGILVLRARDNGSGLPVRPRPGMGVNDTLSSSLATVGGSARFLTSDADGACVVITVPTTLAEANHLRTRPEPPPFDMGRLLVTAPLASACVAGLLYLLTLGPLLALDRTGGAHHWLTIAFGIAGSLIAVSVVIRRRHTTSLVGLGLIAVPALVPWLLRTAQYGCVDEASVASVLNVAGFAVIVIAAWSRLAVAFAGITTWAVGGFVLISTLPTECHHGIDLAIVNSLILLPLTLAVASAGVRATQRAASRQAATHGAEISERSRALAEADLNADLAGAADAARDILVAIADGAELDASTTRRLEYADARIRMSIQVDPSHSGAFCRTARRLVEAALGSGIPVTVRAIGSSADTRPLPAPLEAALEAAVMGTRSHTPTLQAFTDGVDDHLSLLIDHEALAVAGLVLDHTRTFDDVTVVAVSDDDGDCADPAPPSSAPAPVVVVVSRPVRPVSVGVLAEPPRPEIIRTLRISRTDFDHTGTLGAEKHGGVA